MVKNRALFVSLSALSIVALVVFVRQWMSNESRPEETARTSPFSKVSPNEMDEIHIKRNRWENGAYIEEKTVLKKIENGKWRLTVPVVYPANNRLVHEIVTNLCAMQPVPVSPAYKEDIEALQLTSPFGIEVSVFGAKRLEQHFIVGVSRNRVTYLRAENSSDIYTTPGHLRKIFDRSPSVFRNRTIAAFDKKSVLRITYLNNGEPFAIVKTSTEGGDRYRPENNDIHNFDSESAAKKVAAFAALNAQEFYDEPYSESRDMLLVTVDLQTKDDPPKDITFALGGKDPQTGLYFLTVSTSPQVFLVPAHFRPLFTAKPEDFERTDEEVKAAEEWKTKMEAHEAAHKRRREALMRKNGAASGINGLYDDYPGTDPDFENHIQ